MNAYHVIDALSQSFFALLGIWAAVDRRHWFVRFAVVAGILLVALLIPAYEVVIEFGLQMSLIMAGVWLARGRRQWRPRLSVETALLAMVVVAVATAVIARIPDFEPGIWAFVLTVGICSAYAALLALWVVCGHARLSVRVIVGLLGLALFVLIFHFGQAMQHALWRSSGGWNWMALREYYTWEHTSSWLERTLPTIALAAPIMITMLVLARASRWFGSPEARTPAPTPQLRRTIAARFALVATSILLTAPLAYTFYRLRTPPALALMAKPPTPNGFDDFVAAGNMIPSTSFVRARASASAFKQLFRDLRPAIDRIKQGLERDCLVLLDDPQAWAGVSSANSQALEGAYVALLTQENYHADFGTPEQHLAALLMMLKFEQQATRGSMQMLSELSSCDDFAIQRIQSMMYRFDAAQLRHAASQLLVLENEREPFQQKAARQLIYDKNAQWGRHAAILFDTWSGKTQYDAYRKSEMKCRVRLRLLAADLAVQAYWLEHQRPPDSLAQLVPAYLPAVPQDVYADSPLRYRREGARYSISSVGPDGVDDGDAATTTSYLDDEVATGPHRAPLWMQARDWAAIGWEKLGQRLNGEGEAPAEP